MSLINSSGFGNIIYCISMENLLQFPITKHRLAGTQHMAKIGKRIVKVRSRLEIALKGPATS